MRGAAKTPVAQPPAADTAAPAAAPIEFSWDIHHACNYRCPYCFSHGHWEELARMNRYFPVAKWLEAWHAIRLRHGRARIKIACGEPFTYPAFFDLAAGLSQEHSMEIVTNLSCRKEELSTFLAGVSPGAVTLYASFHPRFAEFEPFIEKALLAKAQGVLAGVNFVAYPPDLEQAQRLKASFNAASLTFGILPFRGMYHGAVYPDSYTEAEKQAIHETARGASPKQVENLRWMVEPERTRGRLCRAGQAFACVESDGTVFRCGESKHKPIGCIFDQNLALSEEPRPCEKESCPCEFRWLVRE